jgi:two-component sensor histidine kinase
MSVGLPDSAPWLLLEEMMHRVANEYVTAASMLLLSAARASSSDARDAINAASDLLQQYAKVHKTLQLPRRGARLDLSNYLSDLCLALAKSRLEDRDIHLTFVVDAIELEPERCWHVGLIVAELITNSAKTLSVPAGEQSGSRCDAAHITFNARSSTAAPAPTVRGRGEALKSYMLSPQGLADR